MKMIIAMFSVLLFQLAVFAEIFKLVNFRRLIRYTGNYIIKLVVNVSAYNGYYITFKVQTNKGTCTRCLAKLHGNLNCGIFDA